MGGTPARGWSASGGNDANNLNNNDFLYFKTMALARSQKILLSISAAGLLAAVLMIWLIINSGVLDPRLKIYFLDVGQGDSALIRTPYGQNILVDGGPDDKAVKGLGKALPFYDKKIDLMILSHPHDDHYGGLIDVLRRYRVERVLWDEARGSGPLWDAYEEAVIKENAKVLIASVPQEINLGNGCNIKIIYPPESFHNAVLKKPNDASIVFRLDCAGEKILFTGDAEQAIEKSLVDAKADIKSDLIKIPHHGSDTGSTQEFLSAVGANEAVISVGLKNKFGHPSLRTTNRIVRAGMEYFRTDQDGTVECEAEKGALNCKSDK
jgi:competence protein ComEC